MSVLSGVWVSAMITKLPRLRKKVFDDEGVRPSLFTQREIHEIVRRHGLILLRSHESQDIHLVRAPAAARPEDFLSHVRPDHDVKGIEPDTDVMLPEAPAGVKLDQSTASILDTLSHGTLVSFYRSRVEQLPQPTDGCADTERGGASTRDWCRDSWP